MRTLVTPALLWLLTLFTPGIIEGEPGDDPAGDINADPAESIDADSDIESDEDADPDGEPLDDEPGQQAHQDGGGSGDEPPPRRSRSRDDEIEEIRRESRETKERAIRTEQQLQEAHRLLTQAPSQEQRIFQQEEAQLADPNISEQQRWQIGANRTLRQSHQSAQQAQFTASDMLDQARFEREIAKQPKLSAYAERVEKKHAELLRENRVVDRTTILHLLVGADVTSGKFKTKGSAAGAPARQAKKVDRGGDTPRARSDVGGSGTRLTESQKREKRLENQRL